MIFLAFLQVRIFELIFSPCDGPDIYWRELASIVYTVLSELDIGAKLLQLLPRDNANNNLAMAEIPWCK
jgi:hypothetical protein